MSQIDFVCYFGVDEDEELVLWCVDIFGKFCQGVGCYVNEGL